MSVIQYDPENWLLSATRSLGSYVSSMIENGNVDVEMSFPDTRNWTKETPLAKAVIHFEQDDTSAPPVGFGVVGQEVWDDTFGTWELHEAAQHYINFDVGVWVSAEMGGGTKRMELMQALYDIFAPAQARIDLADATNGLNVIAFDGGRNILDRINDVPVWRAMDMTLLLHVFSKHVPSDPVPMPDNLVQDQNLTIVTDGGAILPVETP